MTWRDFWQGVGKFFKAWGKPLLWVAGIVGALFAARAGYNALSAVVGKLFQHNRWKPVDGDPSRIDIQTADDAWTRVKLPDGVTSRDVRAAGVGEGGWTVEVKHETRDRRAGVTADPDNPYR